MRSLSKLSQALLCKWIWRFANEREPLWRRVISRKCGELVGGWNTGDIRGGYGTGLWKDIRKGWHTLSQNVVFSLGDVRRLRFWKDIWCGEVALSNVFPNLFNMAAHKEVMVVDIWDFSRAEGARSLVFVRDFNDWEIEEVERFL